MSEIRKFSQFGAVVFCTSLACYIAVRKFLAGYGKDSFESKYRAQLSRLESGKCSADGNDSKGPNNEHPDSGTHSYLESSVKIIFGSETGNAETLAKSLLLTLSDRGVGTSLINPREMESYDALLLSNDAQRHSSQDSHTNSSFLSLEHIVIFIVSTTGEGDPPSNFCHFFAELKRQVEKGAANDANTRRPFSHLGFAVFALGDSSYKYYCKAGLEVALFMRRGGATELIRTACGDARNSQLEDVFDSWQEKLLVALESQCGITLTDGGIDPPKPMLTFCWEKEKTPDAKPFLEAPSLLEPTQINPLELEVLTKEELSPIREDDGSVVYKLVVNIAGTAVKYQAGDHLGIYASNPSIQVDRCRGLFDLTDSDFDSVVSLCTTVHSAARASLKNVLPARSSLRVVLERYVDLCGPPRKSCLRVIAKYCTDPEERNSFLAIVNAKKGSPEFESRNRLRTVLDYMEAFPTCRGKVPIGHFIELMPRIQPRFYSIASDILSHPTSIHVIIRVLATGLCSQFILQRIQQGDKLFAFVRKSTFHLPEKIEDKPILMIGPGTGVAPMLGLCYRREAMMHKIAARRPTPIQFASSVLFYGARHRQTEFFVEKELKHWMTPINLTLKANTNNAKSDAREPNASMSDLNILTAGDTNTTNPSNMCSVITMMDVAFSRDQPDKFYVTDLITKHKDLIYHLIYGSGNKGFIFVSGDAQQMAKDVDRALSKVLQETGGMTIMAATEHLKKMEKERRYLKDVY